MESMLFLAEEAFTNGGYPFLAATIMFVLAISGAIIASFAGLVAHRIGGLDVGRSVLATISHPPSSCENCETKLRWLDLVPVIGWLAARGRCRSCGQGVPFVYPVVELLAGGATALMPYVMGDFGIRTACGIAILWIGIIVSWIDVREHVIPEELTWALLFGGLLVSPFEADPWARAAGAAACAGAMWVSLAAVGWLRGLDTRAGGDVAMAAAAGAWVGIGGAPVFLAAGSLAFVAYSLPLRLRGVEWVPMGPALAAALLAAAAIS